MRKHTKQIIRKIDAARSQLDTAITLWFHEADPVSIHTLACSAHQILYDINQHRKGPELLFDSALIKDEFRNLAKKYLHKHYNFFKHANKDPDPEGILEFDTFVTELFVMFAIRALNALGIKANTLHSAFITFFSLQHPHLLTEKGRQFFTHNIPSEQLADIRNLRRHEFFEHYNLVVRQTMIS